MFSNKAFRTAGVVGRRQSQSLRKLALSGIATLSACSIGLMSSSASAEIDLDADLGETWGSCGVCQRDLVRSDGRKQEGDVDEKTYYEVTSTDTMWAVAGA